MRCSVRLPHPSKCFLSDSLRWSKTRCTFGISCLPLFWLQWSTSNPCSLPFEWSWQPQTSLAISYAPMWGRARTRWIITGSGLALSTPELSISGSRLNLVTVVKGLPGRSELRIWNRSCPRGSMLKSRLVSRTSNSSFPLLVIILDASRVSHPRAHKVTSVNGLDTRIEGMLVWMGEMVEKLQLDFDYLIRAGRRTTSEVLFNLSAAGFATAFVKAPLFLVQGPSRPVNTAPHMVSLLWILTLFLPSQFCFSLKSAMWVPLSSL